MEDRNHFRHVNFCCQTSDSGNEYRSKGVHSQRVGVQKTLQRLSAAQAGQNTRYIAAQKRH